MALLLSCTACGNGGNGGTSNSTADGTVNSKAAIETLSNGDDNIRDTLTIAISSEPGTIAPYSHDLTNAFLIVTNTFETLIKKDEDGNFQPCLATEWNWLDDLTVQFKLRDDVYFHDGNKMTAEDVAYSLGKMSISSFTKNFFGRLDTDKTEIVDEYTITIHLTEPYAPFEECLASPRGAIISKASYEKLGEEGFGRAPIGTGPMKFDNWVTGDHLEFSRFDSYWGEPMKFNRFVARIIVEGSSRTMELETGGVDIAFDIPISDRDRIANGKATNLISGQAMRFEYVMLNNDFDINKDIRVRKAMAYSINADALVKTVWKGTATVADSFIPPMILGHKAVGPYPYNPEESRKLLAEAGYPDGFEFDFITWENSYNGQVAEVLQSMWAEVGIKANVQVVDLATHASMNNAGEFRVTHTGTTAAIADPEAALMIWPLWRTISLRHNDQKIQDYLNRGVVTYDTAERVTIYGEMMDYCFEQCYVIPLAFLDSAYGVRSDVLNMTFSPDNIPDFTVINFAD